MKRPSFQFYPADWKGNAKLRRCSEAARGAWMDILCTLHDSDEYGVCRWPLADLARSAGVPLKLAKELAEKEVLKGADRAAATYIFTPMHAGKAGDAVVLVDAGDGACWYSSRLVRDEWVRQRRGAATQFTPENQPPKAQPKPSPMLTPKPPIGDGSGDGPSSSSSSAEQEDTSLRSVSPPQAAVTDPKPDFDLVADLPKAQDRRPKPASKPGQEPPGFAEFYAAYPLHKARPAAAKAYAAALKRAAPDMLLTGARRYAELRRDEPPKFTRHPATWLNQDGWLDEESPNGNRTKPASAHDKFFAAGASLIDDILTGGQAGQRGDRLLADQAGRPLLPT